MKEEQNLERLKETFFYLAKIGVSCCMNKIICILSNKCQQNNYMRYFRKLLLLKTQNEKLILDCGKDHGFILCALFLSFLYRFKPGRRSQKASATTNFTNATETLRKKPHLTSKKPLFH
jgi:hypothetical protein